VKLAYFILILLGSLEEREELDILFSELPALLFFTVFTIIITQWSNKKNNDVVKRN